MAVQSGSLDAVKALLDLKAPINPDQPTALSPLMAAVSGRVAISRQPVSAGTDGRQEMVRFLLEKGANVNYRDSGGMTALLIAASNADSNLISLLLEKGEQP